MPARIRGTFNLDEPVADWVWGLAEKNGVSWNEAVRRLVSLARKHVGKSGRLPPVTREEEIE